MKSLCTWCTLCTIVVFLLITLQQYFTEAKLKPGECEVCINVVKQISDSLSSDERKDTNTIEKKLKDYCKKAKGKDNRFCYYIGGTADAATGMLNEVVKPLVAPLPPERICAKLKQKDSQICELQYEKQIDLEGVDLKKLRVKELKKILNDWEEDCKSCIEKSDFVKRIEELKPKYANKKPKTEL